MSNTPLSFDIKPYSGASLNLLLDYQDANGDAYDLSNWEATLNLYRINSTEVVENGTRTLDEPTTDRKSTFFTVAEIQALPDEMRFEILWTKRDETSEVVAVHVGSWTKQSAQRSGTVQATGTFEIGDTVQNVFTLSFGTTPFKGDTGAKITAAAFDGNDILFTLNDASTVRITNGKADITPADALEITSVAFVGDDMVFTKSDASTFSITNAKITLTGPKGDPLNPTDYTVKGSIADADTIPAFDSEAADNPIKIAWSVIKTAFATFYNSVTATLTNKTLTALSNTIYADQIHIVGDNETGSTILKGSPVFASGYNVGRDEVEITEADATDDLKMPAIGIAFEDIATAGTGAVAREGIIEGVDTGSYSVGDVLYVSETAGQLTNVKPSSAGSDVQPVAIVTRSNPGNGVIQVIAVDAYKITPTDGGDIVTKDFIDSRYYQQSKFADFSVIDNMPDDFLAGGNLSANGRKYFGNPTTSLTQISTGSAISPATIGIWGDVYSLTIPSTSRSCNLLLPVVFVNSVADSLSYEVGFIVDANNYVRIRIDRTVVTVYHVVAGVETQINQFVNALGSQNFEQPAVIATSINGREGTYTLPFSGVSDSIDVVNTDFAPNDFNYIGFKNANLGTKGIEQIIISGDFNNGERMILPKKNIGTEQKPKFEADIPDSLEDKVKSVRYRAENDDYDVDFGELDTGEALDLIGQGATELREFVKVPTYLIKIELKKRGLLQSVYDAIAQLPEPNQSIIQLGFDHAPNISRTGQAIELVQGVLQKDDTWIDGLFLQASKIEI